MPNSVGRWNAQRGSIDSGKFSSARCRQCRRQYGNDQFEVWQKVSEMNCKGQVTALRDTLLATIDEVPETKKRVFARGHIGKASPLTWSGYRVGCSACARS